MGRLAFLTERPIAHRGLHNPVIGIVENTASAVEAAIAGGYGIEVDIQASADGEAMVFHDFTLDRLTTASGPVSALTASDLKRVSFRDTRDSMMTLPELLARVAGRVPLLVEIKSAFDGDLRLARRAAELMAAERGPVALMSFDPALVAEVRRRAPRVARGIVAEARYDDPEFGHLSAWERLRLSRFLHWPSSRFQFIAYRVGDLRGPLSRTVRALGLPLLAWTVRTEGERVRALRRADQMVFEGIRPMLPLRGRAVPAEPKRVKDGGAALAAARLRIVDSIGAVAAADWDACAAGDDTRPNPFACHAFLSAVEESGCASIANGWRPQHLVLEGEDGAIAGVVPAYLKSNSHGTYVSDHEWAEAYQRAGGAYHPKVQAAVPFSPSTGRRLLARGGDRRAAVEAALGTGLVALADRLGASSAHVTFSTRAEWDMLGGKGFLQRIDHQFEWTNAGYASYEDFLGTLSAPKRRMLKFERRDALANGITIEWLTGRDLTEGVWDAFFEFYVSTFERKAGDPYFNRAFFSLLGERMADRLQLTMARRAGRYIAGLLNFVGPDRLYGRHWGCIEQHPFLHFEVCYYQGIEYAIAHKLAAVEGGHGGGHKIARGFLPQTTYSAHWIADPGLRAAISEYLEGERAHEERRAGALAALGPFRRGPVQRRT